MIKIIRSQTNDIEDNSNAYLINMDAYKTARVLWKILLCFCIIGFLWVFYDLATKKKYETGYVLKFNRKFKIPMHSIDSIEELTHENGNSLLGAVAGGVLFGGIGMLGGALLGSAKSGHFVMTVNGNKTLIEIKGTKEVKLFRELSLNNQVFASAA